MRDLIKKVLKEYINPVLVYEIVVNTNLLEQDFIRSLVPKEIRLLKNYHSQEGVGFSKFSRVEPEDIDNSISDIEDEIIFWSKKIANNCSGKNCSIIVVDKPNGFDYHVWLRKKKNENIDIIINTSIHHPNHLFNPTKSPMLIINMDGTFETKFI